MINNGDNMNILHMTLTKEWFDLILSGVKTEEYRAIKPYWNKRLINTNNYTAVKFVNGYGNDRPAFLIELKDIVQGFGKLSWGAPREKVYILKLGSVLGGSNIQSNGKHDSHATRSSDSSLYDEVCINCGATDIAGAGWGKLSQPCTKA